MVFRKTLLVFGGYMKKRRGGGESEETKQKIPIKSTTALPLPYPFAHIPPHRRDYAPPPAPPPAETPESPRDALPKMPGQNEKEVVASKDQVDAQVKSADMSDEMQQEAIEIAQEAMLKFNIEKDIAQHIKKTFDDRKGPTWHCIVGRNFGSFVTHGS
ncbi:hypothetical protein V498_09136 [Pseudogymnoascus sp. VKM F-4517 (FW-2822)]|nr:hypothetical protein V498_09136 [Pseudogymnoascus sp. VKM F-4517 (FW-2822)]